MPIPPASRPWSLLCHPSTPCGLPLEVLVSLSQTATTLALRFELHGEIDRIRVPAQSKAGPADGLWQHTCMELFVAQPGFPAYREFNFSPSGQWAAYCFEDERQRSLKAEQTHPLASPDIGRQKEEGILFALAISLPASALPESSDALLLGLSVVLERDDGHLSYWALHHPRSDRPDFHHRSSFVLPLPRPHAT